MLRPVCLIIRDGWGVNENEQYNAVNAAYTPNIDAYKKKYPHSLLKCSGEAVGLPEGYQGSSEVGHLNMGAGRIVVQELKRIDDSLRTKKLFKTKKWLTLIEEWKKNKSSLHLLGLLQDEGVHAHQEHLFKIMRNAREEYPEGSIILHPFLDGRDTSPRSSLEYLATLKTVMEELKHCKIGAFMGRYYAMDRSKNWTLTDMAYDCIVSCEGKKTSSIEEAVVQSYENDTTPDNVEMFDEYIQPHVMTDYKGVKNGDCIFHTNYRQDRAIQLSRAFINDNYPGNLKERKNIFYIGFTQYYDEFEHYLMESMGSGSDMKNLLGEVIAKAGLQQLRIAETQKFRHVTSFFNGKNTTPYEGEDQVEIKGRFDPAKFASHPEMEAYNLNKELLKKLENNIYSLIVINYANGDMVGHTGNFEAAKRAIEVVDECVGAIVKRLLELDAHILITADHGNSEQMIDYQTGLAKTSHTLHPVDCIYLSKDSPNKKLANGILADIAPSILNLLHLDIPKEMTAKNLILN